MTIYRAGRHFSRLGYRTLVLSPDSDFNYIPSSRDIFATLRFVKFRAGSTMVNNVSLHDHSERWTWRTDYARVAAVMLSGHDYNPGGISNIGLTRLHESRTLVNVSQSA